MEYTGSVIFNVPHCRLSSSELGLLILLQTEVSQSIPHVQVLLHSISSFLLVHYLKQAFELDLQAHTNKWDTSSYWVTLIILPLPSSFSTYHFPVLLITYKYSAHACSCVRLHIKLLNLKCELYTFQCTCWVKWPFHA